MNLPEFSVRQTVLVNVLFFVCLFGGIAAFLRIPVEFYPNIVLNEVSIDTVWTGASAEEVERLVTQKLEEELVEIADIDAMRSVSQANLSNIQIEFDEFLDEVEYQAAVNDVRAAIDRAEDLPDDAEEPVVPEGRVRRTHQFITVDDVSDEPLAAPEAATGSPGSSEPAPSAASQHTPGPTPTPTASPDDTTASNAALREAS